MHYCGACDEQTPMAPVGDWAVCPRCGAREGAVRMPVVVVTGASGSGKTAIREPLTAALTGTAAVMDVDWALDSVQMQTGSFATVDWDGFRDLWLAVSHGIAQQRLPTVLLGPFYPQQLDDLPSRRWVGDIEYLLLDCPDDVRRQRLRSRPSWRLRDEEDQVGFGVWLREHLRDRVDTALGTPVQTADRVATWVRGRLETGEPGQAHGEQPGQASG